MDLLTEYDLIGYVDGNKPCPPKVLENNIANVNSTFMHWVTQYQLVLHGFISSMVLIMVTHLGTIKSSNQAWDILKTIYVGRSSVHIMALERKKFQFHKRISIHG